MSSSTEGNPLPTRFTVTGTGIPLPPGSATVISVPSPHSSEPNSDQPTLSEVSPFPAPAAVSSSRRPSSSTRPSLSTGSSGSLPDPASSVPTLGSSPTPSSASVSGQPSSSTPTPSFPSTSPSTSSSHPTSPPPTQSGSSHNVNIGAAIGGAMAGFAILVMIILGILYFRRRSRGIDDHGAITQFDFENRRNGTENHSPSNDDKSDPLRRPSSLLGANGEQVPPTSRANGLDHTLPILPRNTTDPIAPLPQPQSLEIQRPQTTKEEARLIRRLYGHMPTEEIVLIVDGLRAERERQNRDPVGVTPETSRQLRRSVDRNARRSEEQNASGDVDLDSSSVEQVTPPPSMNQDAPPPRYSRLIDTELP